MGVPLNHPFLDEIFPYKPTILGIPIYGNPHIYFNELRIGFFHRGTRRGLWRAVHPPRLGSAEATFWAKCAEFFGRKWKKHIQTALEKYRKLDQVGQVGSESCGNSTTKLRQKWDQKREFGGSSWYPNELMKQTAC